MRKDHSSLVEMAWQCWPFSWSSRLLPRKGRICHFYKWSLRDYGMDELLHLDTKQQSVLYGHHSLPVPQLANSPAQSSCIYSTSLSWLNQLQRASALWWGTWVCHYHLPHQWQDIRRPSYASGFHDSLNSIRAHSTTLPDSNVWIFVGIAIEVYHPFRFALLLSFRLGAVSLKTMDFFIAEL